MFLFYIDESGNEDNPADKYFVLGGVAVFERVAFFLSQAFDEVQAKHFPGTPPIPFHASHMRAGKDFWRNVDDEKRKEVLADLARAIANANKARVILFAAAIEKTNLLCSMARMQLSTRLPRSVVDLISS
jgi:hypothetical protein